MRIRIDFEIPYWTKWLLVGCVGAVLGAGAMRAYAAPVDVKTNWADGQELKAEDLNKNFTNLKAELDRLDSAVPIITAWDNSIKSSAAILTTEAGGAIAASTDVAWRRVGESMELRINSKFTADLPLGNTLCWKLPGQYKGTARQVLGIARAIEQTVRFWIGSVEFNPERNCAWVIFDGSGEPFGHKQSLNAKTNNEVSLAFSVPIDGWGVHN